MLQEKIRNDLNQALLAKDELLVSTLRLLLAEIRNRWIQKQSEIKDEDILGVIRKQIKQRKDSIEAYQKGGRNDLADKEAKEMAILGKYLPQEMPVDDLEKIVKETVAEVGVSGPQDFGKVMGTVVKKVQGRADGSLVAETVKKLLGS